MEEKKLKAPIINGEKKKLKAPIISGGEKQNDNNKK